MYQTEQDLREERRRRVLYLIFAISIGVTAVICAVLSYFVFIPESSLVRLGPEERFATAGSTPVDVAVKKLSIFELIPNRPTHSEDIIYFVMNRMTY